MTPVEALNAAIAAPPRANKGGPLDKLAAEWAQWYSNDRHALEAGFPATFPWYWGQVLGWWQRYDRAYRAETRPVGPDPATVKPRLAAVADERLRALVEGNAAAAAVVRDAAKQVASASMSVLPWLAMGLLAYYLLKSRGAK